MRGLALASRVQAVGGQALLAAVRIDETLRARAVAGNVTVISPTELMDVGSPDDADWLVDQAGAYDVDWVVTDGYLFDAAYQRTLNAAGVRQLVVDDYGHCDEYCAEFVLNQNASAAAELYARRDSRTRLLLGPAYAMLRDEFARSSAPPRATVARADNLLVTMGAADDDNVSAVIATAIAQLADPALRVRLVVGPSNRHGDSLRQQISDSRIELIPATRDMASLMQWADLAISAAGSTSYELCCMGVPSILVIVADNQQGVAGALGAAGAAINVGWHNRLESSELSATLARVRADTSLRRELAERARSMVDGKGSQRVAAELQAAIPEDDATEATTPCAIESRTATSAPDIPHT